ncbi:MAG: hypothetical protein PHG06_10075 [Parabacteroides sp.]|nr:hypothetical protein [Parabacteroides sp.]
MELIILIPNYEFWLRNTSFSRNQSSPSEAFVPTSFIGPWETGIPPIPDSLRAASWHRLGYERIVNDKRILISVEESDDPVVTLKVQGGEDIRFRASDNTESFPKMNLDVEIKEIVDAVHRAYLITINRRFN